MRQTHAGGEMVFVDYAGDTIDIVDPETGEVPAAKLFVATMGASSYTYAKAVASEGLEDWIGAHTRMVVYLGGVPKAVVPDNIKSAVIKPDRCWYSVPFSLIRQEVDVRVTYSIVEVFHRGKCIASHARNPRSHQRCAYRATQPHHSAGSYAAIAPPPCGMEPCARSGQC
jgi:transposase